MADNENRPRSQDEQFVKQKEAAFQEFTQAKGLKTTRQRNTIVRVFFGLHGHISVEELLREVKKVNPRIGYATVYRTLHLLVEGGLVQERRFGDGMARYEGRNEIEHHDHMICLECGLISGFSDPRLAELRARLAEESGFEIYKHQLDLFGVCKDVESCRKRQQQSQD